MLCYCIWTWILIFNCGRNTHSVLVLLSTVHVSIFLSRSLLSLSLSHTQKSPHAFPTNDYLYSHFQLFVVAYLASTTSTCILSLSSAAGMILVLGTLGPSSADANTGLNTMEDAKLVEENDTARRSRATGVVLALCDNNKSVKNTGMDRG